MEREGGAPLFYICARVRLCARVRMCVCARVRASYNCQSAKHVFLFLSSSPRLRLLVDSLRVFFFFFSFPSFLLESLLARELHLFMPPGLSMHFQPVAKYPFLKINSLDKLGQMN